MLTLTDMECTQADSQGHDKITIIGILHKR